MSLGYISLCTLRTHFSILFLLSYERGNSAENKVGTYIQNIYVILNFSCSRFPRLQGILTADA